MQFETKTVAGDITILKNDHFVAIPYDCSGIAENDDGIIPAGTVIPANDSTAVGVLLTDVIPEANPNGSIVIHGFVAADKLPNTPSDEAKAALGMINFI